jgi:two-component system cell cycle sensor histidine kinase/response regulator CckA
MPRAETNVNAHFWNLAAVNPHHGLWSTKVPTALVVDDEPLVRRMVALVLEQDGISVLSAESGADAIELSRSHHGEIDLLVSDIRMPQMDGCTLANQLQAENPDLPVLLISGYYENDAAERYRFPILPKPFSVTNLLRMVHELLNRAVGRTPGADPRQSIPQMPGESGKKAE